MSAWSFVLPAGLALLQASFPQAPPRDTPAQRSPSAIIRGTVVDRLTGAPLEGHPVRLSGRRTATTRTDRNGRYEFSQLAAGSYTIDVELPENRFTYLRQTFGDPQPAGSRHPASSRILVEDGELRDGVDVGLWRALAVMGRVVDDAGSPLANVEITVEDLNTGLPINSPGFPRTTDDLGAFRKFGLAPGTYRVCAVPGYVTASPDPERTRLLPTCFPSAVTDADAQPVVLKNADVGGLEIRLQRRRTVTLSGIVLNASGQPAEGVSIGVIPAPPVPRAGRFGYSYVRTTAGGQFIAYGVTPGEYILRAETGNPSLSNVPGGAERQMGSLPVRVEADVEGLVVAMSRPTKIAGHVTFEDGVPDTRYVIGTTVMVRPDYWGPQMRSSNPPRARVNDDLTFELDGLFGPQLLTAETQSSWSVKAVRYKDADVTDVPTEFQSSSDPRNLEILLTRRAPTLWGHVLNDAGNTAPEVQVFVFLADAGSWKSGLSTTRATRSLADGTYRTGPMRPGEYLVAALDAEEPRLSLADPASFELLARVAEKVVLVEGDQRLVDIRTNKLPR